MSLLQHAWAFLIEILCSLSHPHTFLSAVWHHWSYKNDLKQVKNVSKRPTAVDYFMLYKHKMRAESLFNTRLFVKMSPLQDVAWVQIEQISQIFQIEHSRADCDAAANWISKFVHSTKFSLFSFHFNSSLCLTFLMAKRCHHFLFYFTKKLFLTGLPR